MFKEVKRESLPCSTVFRRCSRFSAVLWALAALVLFGGYMPTGGFAEEPGDKPEEGRFDIYVADKRIGYEQFSIATSADTVESNSVVEFRDPGNRRRKVRLETRLSMDARFVPRAYVLRTDVDGKKGTVTGTFSADEAAFEYQGGERPLKRGLLVGDRYVILDTNIFHHFTFVARQIDPQAGRAQSIEAVIPQELDVGRLKVRDTGLERVAIGGKKMDLHHLEADSGLQLIDLWVDDQKKLHKLAILSKKLEVVRVR